MRCLITGATGFVGPHLAGALRAAGHDVVGLTRPGSMPDRAVDFPLFSVDLSDTAGTERVVGEIQPDWLFHLAGFASPRKAREQPAQAWAGNVTATLNLYQAVHDAGVRPRILFVSSGLVYGDAGPGTTAFRETDPLRPNDPYSASKAAADELSRFQAPCLGLDVVCVRPFNHIGPGPSDYAAPAFARQVVRVERGEQDAVRPLASLDSHRDMTDVRDMVRAYIRLMEVAPAGEVYNAGSGRTYTMREVLERLTAHARKAVPVIEPESTGPVDTAVSRADISKLRAATNWEPAYPLDQTLKDMLEYWRGR